MSATKIERFLVDSSNIKSVGYEDGTLVVEFLNGHLYAYEMPESDFIAFCEAESKGRYFNTQIRGKVAGVKLTGQCPACGSTPEIIGETCAACGEAEVRPIDRVHKD